MGDYFTFEEFEQKMFGREAPKYDETDVYATYKEKIAVLKKEDRIGSALIYQHSMESLMTFRKRLRFHNITVEFLNKYERHMLRKKYGFSTIGIQLRHLRAIVNMARYRGVIIIRSGEGFTINMKSLMRGQANGHWKRRN